ncbi:MAG: DHHW family protein [Bacteroidales bacterium]|nr:DHHW family protein [Bacteroidales bacterium]
MKTSSKIYVALIGIIAVALTVIFNFLPRSTYSELEKRELKTFPPMDTKALSEGRYTEEVSSWYSDSEPFRDKLMYLSMLFKDMIGIKPSKDNVTVHLNAEAFNDDEAEADSTNVAAAEADVEELILDDNAGVSLLEGAEADSLNTSTVDAYEDNMDAVTKMANSGIIIVGSGDNVRALMGFFGTKGGVSYANICNKYKETFGPDVNIYCMPIPTSTEYYCPPSAQKYTKKQWPVFNNIFTHLSANVKVVDVYSELAKHTDEGIYLRTDHHWAPLGGYYAAKVLCQVAGVPFKDLSNYDEHVIHGYVGSMYGYSHDISVKRAPEDFIYYTPRDVEYTTTYINYSINSKYQVTGEGKPYVGPYFHKFKDGSGAAYCTFMGGDTKITKVVTSTKNGRKIIILKDSFGNTLPGYLFYSFEEVHVIDFRYFTKNLVKYVVDNGITDIVFANNIGNASGDYAAKRFTKYLTQSNGAYDAETVRAAAAAAAAKVDSAAAVSASADSSSASPASDSSAVSVSTDTTSVETPPVRKDSVRVQETVVEIIDTTKVNY